MQVKLKNDSITATQWFKDGDHDAVECVMTTPPRPDLPVLIEYRIEPVDVKPWKYREVHPGDWIVEMFDGIHLFSDGVFKRLFEVPR